MKFFAVYLKSKRFIVLKKAWIQNVMVGKPSKVFFSPNSSAKAVFNTKSHYYLDTKADACYDAFIYKAFGKKFLNEKLITETCTQIIYQ